jgi:hypothetical protein
MRLRASAALLVAACSHTPEGPPRLEIADPPGHWQRAGFVELVPAVLPPSTADGRDRIHVFYKLPEGALFTVSDGPSGKTLKVPPGTEADRVEMDEDASGARVLDVRGTRFADGGREIFHVLRPTSDKADGLLVGTEWPRGDGALARSASERLDESVRRQAAPGEDPARTEQRVRRFDTLNDCVSCHEHDQGIAEAMSRKRPTRPTDASGLYLLLATLADQSPVEGYRPYDVNADDPYMKTTCGDVPAELRRLPNGGRRFFCADGHVPIAHLDLPAARAAGDPHAAAVCGSRSYIYAHLDASGRQAFAAAFAECGISVAK